MWVGYLPDRDRLLRMPEDRLELDSAGGMAALQVAQAHLSTLLTATDTLDGKASLVVAVNVALFGVFFGALISATEPTAWVALAAPAPIFVAALMFGVLTLRPREMNQFVAPSDLLTHMTGEYSNDVLAWSYVESIKIACAGVSRVIEEEGHRPRGSGRTDPVPDHCRSCVSCRLDPVKGCDPISQSDTVPAGAWVAARPLPGLRRRPVHSRGLGCP